LHARREAQACSITKRHRKGELPEKEREGGREWEGEGKSEKRNGKEKRVKDSGRAER